MNIPTQMLDLAPRRGTLSLLMLTTLAASLSAQAAFDSGSTGSDGALSPTVNTAIPLPESGVLNYTSINIPSGVTVTFIRNIANTPVYLLAKNDVTIAGVIDIRGGDAKPTGTYGDGALADDGLPGLGGPGGYDGGRGGTEDGQQRGSIIQGGTGLGPGGGAGGIEGSDGCVTGRYFKSYGVGGGYATDAYSYFVYYYCGSGSPYYVPLGKAYGSTLLQPLLGGSGGGGGRGGTLYPGSGGGGGGGALLLATSGILTINGSIDATGGDGGGNAGTGAGGQGAGGSGGAGGVAVGGGAVWGGAWGGVLGGGGGGGGGAPAGPSG